MQEGGDEATWGSHGETAVDGPQPLAHGAAAGVAGQTDHARVDVRTQQQVIQAADAVPGTPHAVVLPEQLHLLAHHVVRRAAGGHRLALRDVDVLIALALIAGLEDEDHETAAHQTLAETLVDRLGLAGHTVPAGAQHHREGAAAIIGDIDVRRHQEPGARFQQQLLDAVGALVENAGHLWLQRAAPRSRREGALNRREAVVLEGVDPGTGMQGAQELGPLPAEFAQAAHVVIQEHLLVAVVGHCRHPPRGPRHPSPLAGV